VLCLLELELTVPDHTTLSRCGRDFAGRQGRIAWQQAADSGQHSLIQTTVGRYQRPIGPKLPARTVPGETAVAVAVLIRMIRVAKPTSVRRT
jgi:hypothetical protein